MLLQCVKITISRWTKSRRLDSTAHSSRTRHNAIKFVQKDISLKITIFLGLWATCIRQRTARTDVRDRQSYKPAAVNFLLVYEVVSREEKLSNGDDIFIWPSTNGALNTFAEALWPYNKKTIHHRRIFMFVGHTALCVLLKLDQEGTTSNILSHWLQNTSAMPFKKVISKQGLAGWTQIIRQKPHQQWPVRPVRKLRCRCSLGPK